MAYVNAMKIFTIWHIMTLKFVLLVNNGDASKKTTSACGISSPLSSAQSCALHELFFLARTKLYILKTLQVEIHSFFISVYQDPKVNYLIIFRLHSFNPNYYFISKSIGMVSNADPFLSLLLTNQSIQSEAEKNKFVFLAF